jgi:hypothetical protein
MNKIFWILGLTIILTYFNSLELVILAAAITGFAHKNKSFSFYQSLLISSSATLLAYLLNIHHQPSVELVGNLFGGLDPTMMIVISLLYTVLTISIVMKAVAEFLSA